MASVRSISVRALSLSSALCLVLGGIAAGCGNAFDSQSNVQSLRAFAVKIQYRTTSDVPLADESYVRPGSRVSLDLLYYNQSARARHNPDGSKIAPEILWIPGCEDPDGDLYYGCFPKLAGALGAMSAGLPANTVIPPICQIPGVHCASSTQVDISADIISRRPTPAPPTVPYGLSYVFWMVCNGQLRFTPSAGSAQSLPIGCFDEATNQALGTDDFVVGYTPVYAYDAPTTNHNPVVTGMTWDTKNLGYDVTRQGSCAADPTMCTKDQRCGSNGYCLPVVPHCTTPKVADCPTYGLKPLVDRSIVESDTTSPPVAGVTPSESIWVAYYATQGYITKDLRLLNDSVRGWQDDFGTEWSAPNAAAGEARIYAVIHDNRGGTGWWWQDVYVE